MKADLYVVHSIEWTEDCDKMKNALLTTTDEELAELVAEKSEYECAIKKVRHYEKVQVKRLIKGNRRLNRSLITK